MRLFSLSNLKGGEGILHRLRTGSTRAVRGLAAALVDLVQFDHVAEGSLTKICSACGPLIPVIDQYVTPSRSSSALVS